MSRGAAASKRGYLQAARARGQMTATAPLAMDMRPATGYSRAS